MPAPEHPRAASVAEATPQQALATVYDEGAVAYERYWAPVLHRHAVELVDAVPAAEPQTGLTVVDPTWLKLVSSGSAVDGVECRADVVG